MSLMSSDLNPDAAGQFYNVTGRYPDPSEVSSVNWLWQNSSWADFPVKVATQFGTAPISTAYAAPTRAVLTAAPDANQFLGLAGLAGPLLGGIAGLLGGKGGPVVPAVAGPVAGAAAGLLPDVLKGLLGGTGAKPNTAAPTATFFGGECPPGRVLRRKPGARDICIKKPRMNVFNPRALARADRRVTSFARRSKAILQDLGYHVSPRKKSVTTKKRRR